MNDKHKASVPFSGYRVTLMSGSTLAELPEGVREHPVLATLRAGEPAVLSTRDAATFYEVIDAAGEKAPPVRLIPIRCNRARALPFESVALSAIEILYIVHEGFFSRLRCREAAIAAVQACGALPVPSIGLAPIGRHAQRAIAEHHVDTLIEREAEVHFRPANALPRQAQA